MPIANYSLKNRGWFCNTNPHHSYELNRAEIKELFDDGGWFIRNIFNWDKGTPGSFWYVIKDSYGGLDELPAKVRNQVRKSLRCYDIKMVSSADMVSDGLELFNNSRRRFGDKNLLVDLKTWEERCYGSGQDFWLAYDKKTGIPQAFAINRPYSDYCSYVSMGVNPDAPGSTYPMYGLILIMNQYYLENKCLSYVCDGARSVTEHSNIQPFLIEKFRFRKAYCDMKVYYKFPLGLAIRLLFPLRHLITNKKLSAILNQEAIAIGIR